MKKLEEKMKQMKAKRRANIINSESDQDEEEQGRNLLEDLDLQGFETHTETQVPPHPDPQGKTSDTQESESVQDRVEALNAAKILAESAKKKTPEGKIIYSRKAKKDSAKKGIDTSPQKVDTVRKDVGTATTESVTAEVTPRRKGKEQMIEEESVTPVRTIRQKAEEEAGLAEALRLQEEELAEAERKAEEERLNFEAAMEYQAQESPVRETEIDWEDPQVQKYHAQKNKPKSVTVAQARKNMIVYLKHQGNYTDKDFKGMSYNDIRPIFERT